MLCTKNLIVMCWTEIFHRTLVKSLAPHWCQSVTFILFDVHSGCCEHRNLYVAWNTGEVRGLIFQELSKEFQPWNRSQLYPYSRISKSSHVWSVVQTRGASDWQRAQSSVWALEKWGWASYVGCCAHSVCWTCPKGLFIPTLVRHSEPWGIGTGYQWWHVWASGSWLWAHSPVQQAADGSRAAPSSASDPQRVETDTALSSQRFIFLGNIFLGQNYNPEMTLRWKWQNNSSKSDL